MRRWEKPLPSGIGGILDADGESDGRFPRCQAVARMKGRDGISRAFYVIAKEKRVWVARIFVKKTQKTPRKEIKLFLEKAKEIT